MTDFDNDFALETDDRSSPQFYMLLACVFAGFMFLVLVAALLFVKLRPALQAKAALSSTPAVAAPSNIASYIVWERDYYSAMDAARQTGKPVMMSFYTDWCGACKHMDSATFPAPEVIAETQNFVNVRINADADAGLAQHYGVRAYPTYIFLDSSGNVRHRIVGGYSPSNFVQQMQIARS